MRLRLPLLLVTFSAGFALGACEIQTSDTSEEAAPPPLVEAPAAEDVAEEAAAEEPETAQQTAPPPTDTGDMGDARPSEESVQPDSETVFY
jgi:hypothetical protein